MTERKRAGKSFAITFDEELEAMALIKKAMNIAHYAVRQHRIIRWMLMEYLPQHDPINIFVKAKKGTVRED